ncbi:MAG: DMT family transporter [Alphaproteobacteria bacterium]|nr:DMT family transporter [Alphaproteobacteria bacterium]
MLVLAMALLAMQEAIAKFLASETQMTVMQVVWARYAGHLSLMLAIFLPRMGTDVFKSKIPLLQTGRSLLLLLDTALFFTGLTLIGLAEATSIFFITPLLVVLLSIPLLGEKVGLYSFLAIFVGFIGMLIIVRPGFEGMNIGGFFIIGAAICMSLFNVSTRKLAGVEAPEVTMVFTALVGFVVTSCFLPFMWVSPTGLKEVAGMIFIGLFGGVAHSLFILAHEQEEASKLAPFMYFQIIFAIGLGWLMFSMLPDLFTLIGSSIVVASGLVLWQRGRLSKVELEN